MKRAQLADRERRLRAEVRMKAGRRSPRARNLGVTGELLEVNRNGLGLIEERVRAGAPSRRWRGTSCRSRSIAWTRAASAGEPGRGAAPQLKALAGLPPERRSRPGELEQPRPCDWTAASGLARALAGRPDIRAARADAALARARIRKEEAEGRWDASVNVGYQRQETGFGLNGITDRGAPARSRTRSTWWVAG